MHAVVFLSTVLEGKRKRTSHSAGSSIYSCESSSQFSSVESQSETDDKHKHRKHKRQKSKRSKKKRRESKKEKNAPPPKHRYCSASPQV